MNELAIEIQLTNDYYNVSSRMQVSEECVSRLQKLTVRSKRTKVGTRILTTQIIFILLLSILLPATAYSTIKVSDALLEKVKYAGLTDAQIEDIYKQLVEGGFTEEDIESFPPLLRNKNGQTYGIDFLGGDLVAVTSQEGKFGYVYRTDLDYGSDVKTPEEAIAYMKSRPEKRVLPVYQNDGKTVIGTFIVGN